VATDSLKFHPGPPCPTLLHPVGGPALKRQSQGWPAHKASGLWPSFTPLDTPRRTPMSFPDQRQQRFFNANEANHSNIRVILCDRTQKRNEYELFRNKIEKLNKTLVNHRTRKWQSSVALSREKLPFKNNLTSFFFSLASLFFSIFPAFLFFRFPLLFFFSDFPFHFSFTSLSKCQVLIISSFDATSRHVMPRYATWSHMKPCDATWRHVTSRKATSHHVKPSEGMWSQVKSCEATWGHMKSCHITQSQVTLHESTWKHVKAHGGRKTATSQLRAWRHVFSRRLF
jgi:hypothetical protein